MTETNPGRLGRELRQVREIRGESLRSAANSADISSAYLLKLEQGLVRSPSPHVLRNLARHFAVPYLGLMDLAGYDTTDNYVPRPVAGVLADAMASEPLSDHEQRAVAAFLSTLRSQGQG